MYLSKLEIVGFKSFGNKTIFKFTEGMTSFVGPNGCGKSNVVDAIRWVLGEQKTSVLRSDQMENVIFNGTGSRKPLGMAEVSLTIQNTKNKLPTEYTEVTITRRLFRDGESKYLINNTVCRLRDINDLFMDTGVGPDSYSVIELKMVEAILSGKPEERRHLFEEAAGVTKYKQRRKETTRKLLAVQNDLVRIEDIVSEVQKQVNSLSRQAAKTRRYNKLMEQHRELDEKIVLYEFNTWSAELNQKNIEIDSIRQTKLQSEKDLNESEESIKELENKAAALDRLYQEARDKENSVNSQIAQKNKEIAVAHEKIASINNTQSRIKFEIEDSEQTCQKIDSQLTDSQEKLTLLQQQHENSDSELAQEKEKQQFLHSKVAEQRENVNDSNESVSSIQSSINSANSILDRNKQRKESLENTIEENNSNADHINDDIKNRLEQKEAKAAEKLIAENNISSIEKTLAESQERQAALQNKMEDLRNSISDEKNILNKKETSLEFLSGLIDADESSKFLLSSQQWNPAGEKLLLAEAVAADDQYRIAVDAALGEASRYFVVDSKEEALSAFNALKTSEKGKATFICRASLPQLSPPENIELKDGIIGWVSEIVRTDDTLRNAVRAVAGRTLITRTLSIAIDAVDSKICDTAVTLDGEMVRPGIIRGGAVADPETLAIGKKEKIENLQKDIAVIISNIQKLDAELQLSRQNFTAIDIKQLSEQLRKAESEKNNLEKDVQQIEYQIKSHENKLEILNSNSQKFAEEIAAIEAEEQKFINDIEEAERQLAIASEDLQININKLSELEDEYALQTESTREIEMNAVKLASELNNLRNEINRLGEQKQEILQKNEKRNIELEENNKHLNDLKNSINSLEESAAEIKQLVDEAQSNREYIHQQMLSVQEQLQMYTDDYRSRRKNYDRTVELLHQEELKINETKTLMRNLILRAKESFEIDLEIAEFIPEENFSIQETKAILQDIKTKLASVGNVNFMALEEYETQNQRLTFYNEQVSDLFESEKNLKQTIEEINETAERKFEETFEVINNNFKTLFTTLFGPEGEAKLKLAEGNPLETDIEIIAKPPHKRPHSIESLSSGEKTLTAIALLFAIYLVKPSPFCILDEVDAPLDDNNIDKFLRLIHEFSNNTQFMIVSHNKRTMASADTLYGITMEEEGLSKVVSVRLDRAEESL